MADRRAVLLGAAFVTLIMVVSSMGLLLVVAPAPVDHAGSGVSVAATRAPSAAPAGGSSPPAIRTGLTSPLNLEPTTASLSPLAQKGIAASQAAGVPLRDVYVPRAGASPAQVAQATAAGHVTPLYTQYSPAPIGLADYGLSANPNGNGSVVPSILNTQSLQATFDPNATGVQPNYPFSSSPDAYGVQLNAVTTNINLFGQDNYSFWTQNVFTYYAQLHLVYLVTNVWNFSGGPLSANVFAAHGPYGFQVGTTYYYSEYEIPNVVYPFNLTLWMNNSLNASRNQVSFTVGLQDPGNPTVDGNYAYDWVVFNSTAAAPSTYTANGYTYNPIGLTDDFEVILGGPGGGSEANLYTADANMSLDYWNATTSSFQSVPSAFSYGGETGETVSGGYVGWQNNTIGQPYGVLTSGPGILEGLWNATGQAGLDQLTLDITPTNAFYYVAPNWTSNFSYEGNPYWAPQELTNGVFWLAPGNYNLTVALSDYDEWETSFTLGALGVTITQSLVANASVGIYTPLYFWQNSQFAALSTGGAGTPTSPYQIDNTQVYDFPSIFGLFNDYTFPVYTGVMTWGTTASVAFSGMPSLTTGSPYVNFPATNDLGYTIDDSSNVSIVNSTDISGWFTEYLEYGIGYGFAGNYYATFSLFEWNSTNVLIANDTFQTQAAGADLSLGTNNTVWGNTFEMIANPNNTPACVTFGLCMLNLSEGLQQAEGGDLIYNNAFYTTYTAAEPPFNVYSGGYQPWSNTWNITPTPAATVNFAPNWPDFPLSGTIIGNATQGGNFWWNYGYPPNDYGVLPYNDSVTGIPYGQIYVGGDSYPLVLITYVVTFTETGLPAGSLWSVYFDGATLYATTASIAFNAQNGTLGYAIGVVPGYTASPVVGNVTVAGTPLVVDITFSPLTYAVTFTESGLPAGTQWSVTVDAQSPTSTTPTIVVDLGNGTWAYTVAVASGYTPLPAAGNVVVNGAATGESITYSPPSGATYIVTFTESGLTAGTSWSATLNGATLSSMTSAIAFSGIANGSYSWSIPAVAGYNVTSTSSGMVTVAGLNAGVSVTFAAASYAVEFTESGLASGAAWSVTIGTATVTSHTTSLDFWLVSGSYSYTVVAVSGYTASPSSGMVAVSNGAPSPTAITFTAVSPTTYSVTFTESGLPAGTNWSVTLGTSTKYSTTTQIVFTGLANASYNYGIPATNGYTASPSASSVDISGASQTVSVTFSSSSTGTSSSGLTTLEWVAIGAVIAIIIIALLVAIAMRGRRGGGNQDDSSTSGTSSGTEDDMSGGSS
jgi:thermopsin